MHLQMSSSTHLVALLVTTLSFSVFVSSTSVRCHQGYFVRRVNNVLRCAKCRPGTYSVLPNSVTCTPCPRNTFSTSRGARVRRVCFPCPPNTISARGASKCNPCPAGGVQACRSSRKCISCPLDTIIEPFSCTCEKCQQGQRTLTRNALRCFSVPNPATGLRPGETLGDMFLSPVNDTCPLGYSGESDCELCGFNRFRSAAMSTCQECPFGTVTRSWQTANAACLPCPPGRYVTDLTTYTSTNEQVSYCAACPAGWTTNEPGRSLCHQKSAPRTARARCPAGAFLTRAGDCHSCGANSIVDRKRKVCVQCPPGSVSEFGLSTKCNRCRRGEQAFASNSWATGFCSCTAGRRLVARRDGTIFCARCRPGQYARDDRAKCEKCPPGSVPRVFGGDVRCEPCPTGTTPFRGRCLRKLPRCPRGLVRAPRGIEKYAREGECIDPRTSCPAGTRLKRVRSGKLFCFRGAKVVCPEPSFQRYNGRDRCISCRVGERIRKVGGVLKCQKCSAGTGSLGGKTLSCRKCDRGLKPSGDVLGACVCPPGRFVDRSDGNKCKRCPAGTFNDREGVTECRPCGKGFDKKSDSNGPTLCDCPSGKVVDIEGNCIENTFQNPEYTTA